MPRSDRGRGLSSGNLRRSGAEPWKAPGKHGPVQYNPAIYATHSPDTGVPGSSSAWWQPGMCGGMADLKKIWHQTSYIIDPHLRQHVTRQMMAQYAQMPAADASSNRRHESISAPQTRQLQTAPCHESTRRSRSAGSLRAEKPKNYQKPVHYQVRRPFIPEIEFGTLSVEHRTGHVFADRLMGLTKAW
ncbi:unnamed protein product [Effrenium voratum]|uniref:Uncharacterized protein n=1 Tax=Effrenium voratum TaxID=2562239 RepID=A0AA36HVX9_9DINO|nr:unnamed protein product [Effrenium voratum]